MLLNTKTGQAMRLLVATTGALLAVVSPAAARPRVALTVPAAVNAGSPIPVSWKAAHLVAGTSLVVQKPVGTAAVWKTIAVLPRRNQGTASLAPFSSLGTYRVRIAAIQRRKVVAQQQQPLHVFQQVPFSQLLIGIGATSTLPSGVHATLTAAFPFVDKISEVEGSKQGIISDEKNYCGLVHLEFVADLPEIAHQSGGQATLTVVQERAEPISATVGEGTVGTLDAHVVPGESWAVNTSQTARELDFYLNGYAVCDSTTPISAL